jgi:hypothetical protein
VVMMPGARAAWFACSDAGRAQLRHEARVLSLLAERLLVRGVAGAVQTTAASANMSKSSCGSPSQNRRMCLRSLSCSHANTCNGSVQRDDDDGSSSHLRLLRRILD